MAGTQPSQPCPHHEGFERWMGRMEGKQDQILAVQQENQTRIALVEQRLDSGRDSGRWWTTTVIAVVAALAAAVAVWK